RWLLVAGVATTGLAISVLLIPQSFVSLLVAGVGTGLGAALLLPPILLELTKRSNVTDRGTAMALYNTSFAAAVGAGSLGGAVLVQRFGFNATLVISLVACLAAAAIALATIRRLEDRCFRLRPTAGADRTASAGRAGCGPHAGARSVLPPRDACEHTPHSGL